MRAFIGRRIGPVFAGVSQRVRTAHPVLIAVMFLIGLLFVPWLIGHLSGGR